MSIEEESKAEASAVSMSDGIEQAVSIDVGQLGEEQTLLAGEAQIEEEVGDEEEEEAGAEEVEAGEEISEEAQGEEGQATQKIGLAGLVGEKLRH